MHRCPAGGGLQHLRRLRERRGPDGADRVRLLSRRARGGRRRGGPVRARWRALAVVGLSGLAPWAGACALPQQMLAAPDDLADYRAFRVAAHEGRRLFQAQRYLERHPHGAFSEEVRAVFDREEAAWFEAAKTSRVRAKEYVVDLPDGPHAEAARSLMVLFDEHQEDTDTLSLLADARHTAATLDYETARRRRLGE